MKQTASLVEGDCIKFQRGDLPMKLISQRAFTCLSILVLASAVAIPTAFAAKADTFTGQVSDAMCGAKHAMAGNPADCARACAGKGSKYALVVGDKVYTLESKDKSTLSELNRLAGEKAEVTGKANGDSIAVTSVAAVK
jgi:hypothetical protein